MSLWKKLRGVFGVLGDSSRSESRPRRGYVGPRGRRIALEPLEDRRLLAVIGADLLADGLIQVEMGIADSPPPPPSFVDPILAGEASASAVSTPRDTAVILSEVPTSSWTYGCGATAAGMLFGYYDRTGYDNMYTGPTNGGVAPLTDLGQGDDPANPISGACSIIATQNGFDGRTTAGHVDDYWIDNQETGPDPWEASGIEHTWEGCTADFMGTNQWKWDSDADGTPNYNKDGSTVFWYANNGGKLYDPMPSEERGYPRTGVCHGLRMFAESRGYFVAENYNQLTDNQSSNGFTFTDYMAEIDAGFPVIVHTFGHMMTGVGYDEASQTVYLHNTWGNYVASMTWGGTYDDVAMRMVTVIHLESPETQYDWGDAPSSYPTTSSSGGASHVLLPTGPFLGGEADAESDGLSSDDLDGRDDEDGVWFTSPLAAGAPGSVSVIASCDGVLNGWLDFNDDGDWADVGEQIFTDVSVTTGVNGLSFDVPSTAVGTDQTYARFRISTVGGLGPGGPAADGEVEDYEVAISDQLGTIEGVRWLDVDKDGIQDGEEPGLGGVQLFLDANDNGVHDTGERVATTAADGSYRFTDVAPGVQIVREMPMADITQTYPGPDAGTYVGTAYVVGTNTMEVTSIDAVTGVVTRSGVVLDEKLEGMVVTNDGRMFGLNGWYDALHEIDRETLQVELVGPAGAPLHWGMAYDRATDAIYGMANVGNTGRKFFVVYDRETGIPVPVNDGSSIVNGSTGMTWDDANQRMVVFYNGADEFFAFDPTGTATRLATSSLAMDGRSLAYNGTSFVVQLVDKDDGYRTLAFFDPDTGFENAPRLTMSAATPMESLEYVPGTPYGHRVYMEPGETVSGLDFGDDAELDFGDAPSPYPTLSASDGARHVPIGPTLGEYRDWELDGQPSELADGDDLAGTPDDEDGVTFGTIQVGQLDATAIVNVQNAPAGAKLDAWIDFNGDGSWGGPFEQIAHSVGVVEGANAITFDVPSWAVPGSTYARFRLSTAGELGPMGEASDGEVEDYQIAIAAPGPASGLFGSRQPLTAGDYQANAIFSADLDGDGDMDVLSATYANGGIVWYENVGGGSFTTHILSTYDEHANSVFAVDVDGDGDLDVLSSFSGGIAWYKNDGTGVFSDRVVFTALGASSLFAADIDSDGDVDLLTVATGTMYWYENFGQGNFIEQISHVIAYSVSANSLFAADVDGDGDMDVLGASVSNDTIAWYENDGQQNFTAHNITTSADGASSVFPADVDGDGDTDVVWASRIDNTIAWYENDGEEGFTARSISDSAGGARSVFAADMDGDGDLDVVAASYTDDTVAWYENDGNGNFVEHTITTSLDAAWSVFAADIDGDNDLDVLTATYSPYTGVAWYENLNPGFTVTESGADTTVSESGDTDSFDVVLDVPPQDDVVIRVSSGDTGAVTIDKPTLTFTSANWETPQTVTVYGEDDLVVDGDQVTAITLSIDAAMSDDAFDSVEDQTVLVTTTDDDAVGIAVSPTAGLTTSEAGDVTAEFTVVLESEPTADVTVAVASDDGTEGTVSPTVLTFTTANWSEPKKVTISGVDDDAVDGDVPYSVVMSVASGDALYDEMSVPGLTVTNLDDDHFDFGDAPLPYATALSVDGARHVAVGPRLGSVRDWEADGVPSTVADSDDTTGTSDDEDGVTFGSIQVGQLGATVTVNVQNAPSGAKLDAWIDYNGDGSWGGPFEQIADTVAVVEGDNAITFDVPSWAVAGGTYARFRLSTEGDLGPGGEAANGEVEDYELTIAAAEPTVGVFASARTIAGYSGGPGEVRAADLDGDGDQDVLAACASDQEVVWFENTGGGDFVPHVIATGVDGAWSVYATDLDSDGDMDVLSASFNDDTIAWYENDGEENFTEHVITTLANASRSVSAADFDGDGDMDVLAAAGGDDKVVWYENDGSEIFVAHTITSSADSVYSVFATDVDGDGDVDALSASGGDDTIAWYENNGSGYFTTHAITTSADLARSVFSADIDGDGDMDVLSASYFDDTIAWYENDGNESFTTHTVTTSADGADFVVAVDVDQDGDMDLLSANSNDDTVAWYENDGGASFSEHSVATSADRPVAVFAADFNGDGHVDVLSSSIDDDRIAWYENDGNESFFTHTIAETALGPVSVFAADMNGDGVMDVLSASEYDDKIAWYENVGDGDLIAHTITLDADSASSVFAVDVDGDGDVDALSASYGFGTSSPGHITWYENDGDEEFVAHTISSSARWARSVFAADMDEDGDVDVLAAYDNSVYWYANDGDEHFSARLITNTIDAAACVHAADVDGDGDMDVLSASSFDDTIAWYENHGNETFTVHAIATDAYFARSVSTADLDNDGDMDVLSTCLNDDRIVWYENDGSEGFSPHIITSEDGGNSILPADLDGDGDLDVLTGSYADGTIPWFENDGFGNFTAREVATSELGTSSVIAADIDGDGDLDLLTASSVSRCAASSRIVWHENLNGVGSFSVVESGGDTTVGESGGTDTLSIVLDSAPASAVTVIIDSGNAGEVIVSTPSVTFTPLNWYVPQVVTLIGVCDSVVDGDQVTVVTLSIDDASSDDLFDTVDDQVVLVTTTDDDEAGITVIPVSDLTTSEGGDTATFTVVLNSEPTAEVSIALSSSDTTEGTVTSVPLTFTATNWNQGQTVTISGANDDVDDGDIGYTILTAAAVSDDANYQGYDAADVTVTNLDDDEAGIAVNPTTGLTTSEAGDVTAEFTVALESEPTADVTVTVASDDGTEGSVSPTTLVFTAANWSDPKTVTINGVDDDVVDGNVAYTVVMSVSSGDALYDGMSVPGLTVTNLDDDCIIVTTLDDELDTDLSDRNDVSLREALVMAADEELYPGADVIIFSDALDLENTPGEIVLLEGQLVVDSDVTIVGPGASQLAIDGDADDDGVGESRLFYVSSGVTATFNGLALRRGLADGSSGDNGGAIQSDQATLTVEGCILEGNSVTTPDSGHGGAIYAYKTSLEVVDSIIRNNSATGVFSYGGGVYSRDGSLFLENCSITQNMVSANRGEGGGVAGYFTDVSISGCTISENYGKTGGGVSSLVGNLSISNTTISENSGSYGGGIDASGLAATLKLENTIVTGNHAIYGGGLRVSSNSAEISNCLISGNTSSGGGGGVTSSADLLTVTNSTIVGNQGGDGGGGILSSETVRIANSIVALNRGGDLHGTKILSAGANNLIGVDPGFVRAPSPGPDGTWNTADDDLGDLHLTDRSAAIDAGNNSLAVDGEGTPLATDLDGNPRVANSTVDVGAYEYQATALAGRELPSTVVTIAADAFDLYDSQISLREALWYVCSEQIGASVITFDASLDGVAIVLDGTELTTNRSVSIDASALNSLEIDADTDGVSSTAESRVLNIIWGGTGEVEIALKGLTITGGSAYSAAGLLVQGADLIVEECTITGNRAGDGYGGGIYAVDATLTVMGSSVTDNYAERGGGVYATGGAVFLEGTTVSENSAGDCGGGLYLDATTTISGSEISKNTSDRFGGGIYSERRLYLLDSLVAANAADDSGGGIYAFDPVNVTNTEVSANYATSQGGGMRVLQSQAILTNSTIAANAAGDTGGIAISYDGYGAIYPVFNNTIIALNDGGDFSARFEGPYVDDTFEGTNNLVATVESPIDPLFVDLRVYSDVLGADEELGTADDGPFGDYRLLSGSPAIDAGSDLYLDESDTDDAGPDLEVDYDGSGTIGDYAIVVDLAGQLRVGGIAVDIGAYETLWDFGDAPAPYATLLDNDGAHHVATGPALGPVRDTEPDGAPSSTADGDDTTAAPDEDGVTFGTIQVGQLGATAIVNVQNAPTGAKLDAWIDFNGDGSWGGPFEQIADTVAVVEGNNTITFDVPSWALAGETYARFRLSTAGDLGPGGEAADGEVEDYLVSILSPEPASGIFAAREPLAERSRGVSDVHAVDLDGDGDVDVLSASQQDDKVVWYENVGGADFIPHTITASADYACSVYAADVDGDGDLDVLSASGNDDKIAWYENDGEENFSLHIITTAADGARSVFAADVDGDGDMDVLSASSNDDRIVWYENDGTASFTVHTITASADEAWSVFAADVDGDGDMDVLSASNADDHIAWYENNGEEVFTAHTITRFANGARSVFAADVDGDGHMDVLSASMSDNTIAWYENDGGEGFAKHTITGSANGATSVFAVDMDGDGDVDVASASYSDQRVAWYENNGNEIFTTHTVTNSAQSAKCVVVADLNGDAELDVIAGSLGQVGWYENDGNENFAAHTVNALADEARSVFAADMDSDGDMDVLSASLLDHKIAWYEQNAEGDFTAHTITTSASGANSVFAADMDGDGDMDVLSASVYDDKVAWYENDGSESFASHTITTAADGAESVFAADLDGDGDLDVISASCYDDKIAWYENDMGSFTPHVITTSASSGSVVFVADVDRDGDVDVLSAGYTTIEWHENDGAGSFSVRTVANTTVGTEAVIAADLDGDGDMDVLSGNATYNTIAWYENDGNESFVSHTIATTADDVRSLFTADVDGDGDLDVLSALRGESKIAWYENDGSENFTERTVTASAAAAYSVFAADMDGDGDVDVLSASSTDDKIAWYENLDVPPDFSVVETGGQTSVWEAGGTDTFYVVLDVRPVAPVVITVVSSDPGEVTVDKTSLTFTPDNWNMVQTVTVMGVDELVDDGDQTSLIILSIDEAASDDLFDSATDQFVSVISYDNDEAGISVNPTSGLMTSEGGDTATFTVVLDSEPTAEVSIALSSSDTTEGTVTSVPLTFTAANWNQAQTVTITGVNDDVADGNIAYTILTAAAVSDDASYQGYDAVDVAVTNLDDDDEVGITVSPVSGLTTSEGGDTAMFTVVLDSEPIAEVSIALSSSDTTEGTVTSVPLTFTAANWSQPQTVMILGVNDDVDDGDVTYTILTAAAVSDDANYQGYDAADVAVTNLDDGDEAGITVSPVLGLTTSEGGGTATFTVVLNSEPTAEVSIALSSSDTSEGTVTSLPLTFTAANWNQAQTVTITGVNDDVADGDIAYTILTAAAVSDDANYQGYDAADVAVTNLDDGDEVGVTVSPVLGLTTSEGGDTAMFTVVLESEPTAEVSIALSSSDTSEGTVTSLPLTFTAANWNQAQTVTITGVNDDVADGDIAYTILTAAAVSDDANYQGYDAADVAVTNLDDGDEAGITVSPVLSLTTSEGGGTATFTVVLESEPTAAVSIALSSSDTTEGTVTSVPLTFTVANWNQAQTVTITGVNDDVDDGDIGYTILTAAAASDDANYQGYDAANVTVTNLDDDEAGIAVDAASVLTTNEAGDMTAEFAVVLESEPVADVTITVATDDGTEGTVEPTVLTFTAGDWSDPQTVTIRGVDDWVEDGDVPYSVVMGVSSNDPLYAGTEIPSLTVTNLDDDEAGIAVDAASMLTTNEAGDMTAQFAVVLESEPLADVTITVATDDGTEGTVEPTVLTFTAGDWSDPQTVTIRGVDDWVEDGDVPYSVVMGVSSNDPLYAGTEIPSLTVTNLDDDEAGIAVDAASMLTTNEAGDMTAQFAVVLESEPLADVTITVATDDGTEGTVEPTVLTFTAGNWSDPQTVTIRGLNDWVEDGDVPYSVVMGVSSNDPLYAGTEIPSLTVTNLDDDEAGIAVDAASMLTTNEAGDMTAQFAVVLESEPLADVTITVATDDGTEGTVEPTVLTFTAGNWSDPQTVTIRGLNDWVEDGDVSFMVLSSVASNDPLYTGMDVPGLTVTNLDDDAVGIAVSATAGLTTSEAGDVTSELTVALESEPTADVTVTVASDDGTEGTVEPTVLTFTAANWSEPKKVTISGVDDDVVDGDVPYSVVMSVSSDDPLYAAMDLTALTVTNLDDDEAGIKVDAASELTTNEAGDMTAQFAVVLESEPVADVTITVATDDGTEGTVEPTVLTFTVGDWSDPQTVTIRGVDDKLDDGDVPYSVVMSVSSDDPLYAAMDLTALTVTNLDDDEAGIAVDAASELTTNEAGDMTVQFAVVLESEPLADVTITVATDDGSEGTVEPTVLRFTAGNWSDPQTVTIRGVDDWVEDGDVPFTVVSSVASNDPLYAGTGIPGLTVTNLDDDEAGIAVDAASMLTTNEAGDMTAQFAVVLESEPLADVTITVATDDGTEGTVEPTVLTFTAGNWSDPQTVTIRGLNDWVEDGDVSFMVLSSVASNDPLYTGMDVPGLTVTNLDDDAVGIAVSATAGLTTSEAGDVTPELTVALESEPTADVTVTVASDDGTEGTVEPTVLTFTAANWSEPKKVTISGVDDDVVDGDVPYSVVMSVSSDDPLYAGTEIPSLTVTNLDDDEAGIAVDAASVLTTNEAGDMTAEFAVVLESEPVADVTITVATDDGTEGTVEPTVLTFTAGDWSDPRTVTVRGVDDKLDDGDVPYSVVMSVSSDDPLYAAMDLTALTVTNLDDDEAGIAVDAASELTTNEAGDMTVQFAVVLESEPLADVTITVATDDGSEGTVEPTVLRFTAGNWSDPQTVTIRGVDDKLDDGDVPYSVVMSVSSDDPLYAAMDLTALTVTNLDDDEAGIAVDAASVLTTNEAGDMTAEFAVVLESEPVADVTITVATDDGTEGTVEPTVLTFTAGDWSDPQTVTIRGVDDWAEDGDVPFTVVSSVASNDPLYAGTEIPSLTVTNLDDDEAGIAVDAASMLTTNEAGDMTAQFAVVLESEPVADVTITVATDDGTEGTVEPTVLTFTAGNWSDPQTVTIRGLNDKLDDGDVPYSVVMSVSSDDPLYAAMDLTALTVTNLDDDEAGIAVDAASVLTTNEAGDMTAEFAVVLESEPVADVTITVATDDGTEGTVEPTALTFTAGDWSDPQTVTIRGVDDKLDDGDVPYSVVMSVSSDDPLYAAMDLTALTVTNLDDDEAGIAVDAASELTTNEAGDMTVQFAVVLESEPLADVTITVATDDGSEGTVEPTVLRFTAGNWSDPQTVTIRGVDDKLDDGDVPYSVVMSVSSDDPLYAAMDLTALTVTNLDDDEAGIAVDAASVLTTNEAGDMTAEFAVVLESEPVADVTITVATDDGSEGTVEPTVLRFTAGELERSADGNDPRCR